MSGKTPKSIGPGSQILYIRKLIGLLLWNKRLAANLSLRDLERASGVSNSEISKVEAGKQQCRLESFIRICSALGIPCGEAIDFATWGNPNFYFLQVVKPAFLFSRLERQWKSELLQPNLAILASFTAHLILCSNPVKMASLATYPCDEIRNVFLIFARDTAAPLIESKQRRSLLRLLNEDPLLALDLWKITSSEILRPTLAAISGKWNEQKESVGVEILQQIGFPTNMPVWFPYVSPENLDLTIPATNDNTEPVQNQWNRLKARIQKATAKPGSKSTLAIFLGVDLTQLSKWLTDSKKAREPGADYALKLLHWVERQEGKQ